MGDAAVKYMKGRQSDRPQGDELAPAEKKALRTIRREAREHGATLASGGKGGLPPSLVLGVFRRDDWQCKKCGGKEMLSIHHKAGAKNLVGKALLKKGHDNDKNNLVVVCESCHDDIHDEDRASA